MEWPVTIVSGYWIIKNKHGQKFNDWFQNSLKIKCPYVFFGDDETIEMVKKHRADLPTFYINKKIEDFYTYQFKDTIEAHEIHCPSKELNMIWNEKIFLIKEASQINPFKSQWFAWIDAGICIYRETPPPPIPWCNLNKLALLPKDKFIFSSSWDSYQPSRLGNEHYHYVSGTYMLHLSLIDRYTEIFRDYCHILLTKRNWFYTDQVIHTFIYRDNPELFHHIGYGWGIILPYLY